MFTGTEIQTWDRSGSTHAPASGKTLSVLVDPTCLGSGTVTAIWMLMVHDGETYLSCLISESERY